MARAETPTLLSIDQWAMVMGFDLFQINQIGAGGGLEFGRDAQCQTVWYQYSWQKQFLSREEIASAIAKAEAAILPLMGFYPAPEYTVAEEHNYPNDARLQTPDWMTPRGDWKSIGLNNKMFREIGTRTRTLIEAEVTVVESDEDGDGVNDTFTLTTTTTTTETNPHYIAVYYNSSDRENLDETWRIRPVDVSINVTTGILTIKGQLPSIVKPSLQKLPNPIPLSVANAIYATSLDVYQVKPDTEQVGTAYWVRKPYVRNATSALISEYDITRATHSYIRPVVTACYSYGVAPDRVEINYLSGVPLLNGKVRAPYAQMIAYLACAYLPALSCGCERADQILHFWRNSPANGEQGTRPITIEEVNEMNLPAVRGGFYAWQQIQLIQDTIGVSI